MHLAALRQARGPVGVPCGERTAGTPTRAPRLLPRRSAGVPNITRSPAREPTGCPHAGSAPAALEVGLDEGADVGVRGALGLFAESCHALVQGVGHADGHRRAWPIRGPAASPRHLRHRTCGRVGLAILGQSRDSLPSERQPACSLVCAGRRSKCSTTRAVRATGARHHPFGTGSGPARSGGWSLASREADAPPGCAPR